MIVRTFWLVLIFFSGCSKPHYMREAILRQDGKIIATSAVPDHTASVFAIVSLSKGLYQINGDTEGNFSIDKVKTYEGIPRKIW